MADPRHPPEREPVFVYDRVVYPGVRLDKRLGIYSKARCAGQFQFAYRRYGCKLVLTSFF